MQIDESQIEIILFVLSFRFEQSINNLLIRISFCFDWKLNFCFIVSLFYYSYYFLKLNKCLIIEFKAKRIKKKP